MKIAIFSDTYIPDINGVATSTKILRDELIKHGHEVVVVTSELPSESDYLDDPDDNILRVPGLEIQALYGYRACNIYSFKGMREIKGMNIEVIHVQTEFGIGIFGRIVGESLNIPVVYTYHTMWADYSHYVNPVNSTAIDGLIKKAITRISKFYGDKSTELIVPSTKTEDALRKYGLNKEMHVIPTGLELDKFDPKNKNETLINQIKQQYGINDQFIITFLGRIAKEKSIDVLIDAMKEVVKENDNNENQGTQSPSDKLNDITTTKIYNVLKKLVSLSYDRYQKGTYKYDKKEIVKHYLTNQKFKILDDLVSPTFKPDVYVFDLSPSNNESLEMYVNAISSVAIKNSLIYLTYNDCILRKLIIKKGSSRPIDVSKIATSQLQKYNNFDCVIFNEYRSLYEELREIKDRKIYIFSDFDISSDISKLSQENQDIVWFSTEKSNYGSSIYQSFFYREYPTSYAGYYVETSGIEDIEKFIMEKNKAKYKRRSM